MKTFWCNSTYTGSDVVNVFVVSVRVPHKQSYIVINTYALLDSLVREHLSHRKFLRR